MNPYLAKDIAHAEQQDREWLRELAIEQRAAEILADPRELDIAVGDQVYGDEPFEPDTFIRLRFDLATAESNSDLMAAAIAFQAELKQVARRQAEAERNGTAGFLEIPAFLRRQAE